MSGCRIRFLGENERILNQTRPNYRQKYKDDGDKTQYYKQFGQRRNYIDLQFSLPMRYEILKPLGKGSYGIVCSAFDTKSDPKYLLAIKKITNIFNKEILLKRAIRELKFMSYFMGHKNIVNLINVELIFNKPYEGLYCYQELIDYDLAKVIHSDTALSEFHIQSFTYQILRAVKYIHSANVIHRDLKPGNILCSEYGNLKICDFGLARALPDVSQQNNNNSSQLPHITNYVATRWYRAPELILSHNEYNGAIDMWSVGCILAEFYHRKPVFMGRNSMDQLFKIIRMLGPPEEYVLREFGSIRSWNLIKSQKEHPIKRTSYWKEIFPFAHPDAMDLLESLLQWDPKKRPDALMALEHPFLQDVRMLDDEPVCPHGPFDFGYELELTSMKQLRQYLSEEVIEFRNQIMQ